MGKIVWDKIYDTEQGRVFIGHANFAHMVDDGLSDEVFRNWEQRHREDETERWLLLTSEALEGTW